MLQETTDQQGGPIQIVWHVVESYARRDFSDGIRQHRGYLPIVPLVPEGGRFTDANSLATDFVHTLERNRDDVERDLSTLRSLPQQIIFVLISRRDVALAAAPSPGKLPDWLPHLGGREVQLLVRDSLRDLTLAGLSDPEVLPGEIGRLLFEVDRALVRRIRDVVDRSGQRAEESIARTGLLQVGTTQETVRNWEDWLSNTGDPGGYRLDIRGGSSPLALLVRLVAASSPDALYSKARELFEGLDLPKLAPDELPLTGVLYKPMSIKAPLESVHGFLINVFAAHNLITAAAHASAYPRFTVGVLASIAREIRRGLRKAVQQLERY